MAGKKKVSECPPKLEKFIYQANYLFTDEFEMERPRIAELSFSVDKKKVIFKEVAKFLRDECFKDHPWLHKVLSEKTVTLNASMITEEENPRTGVSIEETVKFLAGVSQEELKRGYWLEADVTPKSGAIIRPYSQLWRIVVISRDYRKAFREIIGWTKAGPEEQERYFTSGDFPKILKIKGGFVSLESNNPVLDTVIDEQIYIGRIDECPICHRIVWKKQITAETCGREKCAQRNKYLKKQKAEAEKQAADEQRKLARKAFIEADFSKV